MTTTFLSVRELSKMVADDGLFREPNQIGIDNLREVHVWNFQTTGFNASTVATVVAAALAVLLHSPIFMILALVSLGARNAFMKEIDLTAIARGNDLQTVAAVAAARLAKVNPNERVKDLAKFLGVKDPKWRPIKTQFLDFRIWMNSVDAKARGQ
jgi:hypothetical protein